MRVRADTKPPCSRRWIKGGVTTARGYPRFSFWIAIKVPALHAASTFILFAAPEHAEAHGAFSTHSAEILGARLVGA